MTPESGAVYEYADDDSMGATAARRSASARSSSTSTRSIASDGAAVVNWPVLNEDFDAIARAARPIR